MKWKRFLLKGRAGAGPVLQLMMLRRALAEGVRPAVVLLEYWPPLLDHDRAPLPHLFRVSWLFWELRDHMGEARGWVGQLMPAAASLDHRARAELLWAAVATANEVHDDTAALAASQRLAPLLGGIEDPYLQAMCQLVIAWTSPITGSSSVAALAIEKSATFTVPSSASRMLPGLRLPWQTPAWWA